MQILQSNEIFYYYATLVFNTFEAYLFNFLNFFWKNVIFRRVVQRYEK